MSSMLFLLAVLPILGINFFLYLGIFGFNTPFPKLVRLKFLVDERKRDFKGDSVRSPSASVWVASIPAVSRQAINVVI